MEKSEGVDAKKQKADNSPALSGSSNSAAPPQESNIPKKDDKSSNDSWSWIIAAHFRSVFDWLERHDGAVTALATAAIAGLTLFLAVDSRRQAKTANGQLMVMRGQLNEMQAEQRPWISLEVIGNDGIRWDKNGMRMVILFQIENIGKTPAAAVFFESKLKVLGKGGDPMNLTGELRSYATKIENRRAKGKPSGNYIMPGQKVVEKFAMFIPNAELNSFAVSIGGFILPHMLACSDYYFTFANIERFTCISSIVSTVKSASDETTFAFRREDGDIPSNRVTLNPVLVSVGE